MKSNNSLSSPNDRIISIDLLRGIAVLGILIMNIQSMSMPGAAYLNPAAYGDLTGINKWVWIISHVLANEKFMSIFSILFGAGALLFTERAISKGKKAASLHYRRMFWLLIFGVIHAHFIWYGDILVPYSLAGMLIFLFRKKKVRSLMILSAIFFIIPVLLNLWAGSTIDYWPQASYQENLSQWSPAPEKLSEEIELMQGSWVEQQSVRSKAAAYMETFVFMWYTFWRVFAMMLLGMALFKSGFLTAKNSRKLYLRTAVTSLVIGYAMISFGVKRNFAAEWAMEYSMFFGNQFNYIGSLAVALGYISLVMLMANNSSLNKINTLFSKVGKMAFTNYILMSVIGMFIFYGNGLGLFGQVERWEQAIFVLVIWAVILVISPIWLKYFRFGPLEWAWRNLTYWRIHQIKR